MISQDRNAFPCNVMQTNQGPDKLCQAKSHVQTARESHDLNMDFAASKQLRVPIPMQEYRFLNWQG